MEIDTPVPGNLMIRLRDTIAGEQLKFYSPESLEDVRWILHRFEESDVWAMDTESTGVDCYVRDWELRTFQFGNATHSYVIHARFKREIKIIITTPGIRWIGFNGPHDIRSIDKFLGFDTGVVCKAEAYLPGHHKDSRNVEEGGISHGLKEQSIARIDRTAGKWEVALKAEFKKIMVPVPGEVYKSGPRKGTQKYKKATIAQGWSLIDPMHPAYIAYAASDPILTYRLWMTHAPFVRSNRELYDFDFRVQQACDRLQRRGMPIDIDYTTRLTARYHLMVRKMQAVAADYGCANINSGAQLAATLERLGARLTVRTKTGQISTESHVLRGLLTSGTTALQEFVSAVLVAKQCAKRASSYTEAMLHSRDSAGRVHPSIKSLGARTARMSVSNPPFQQLPTKDRESDITS